MTIQTTIANQRPARLSDHKPYAVACEALAIATDHGAPDALQEALFALVQREARAAEAALRERP